MVRFLFIVSFLWGLPCLGLTCAAMVRGELKKPEAIESLAQRLDLNSQQLRYLLETDGLADRVQGLLMARYLIDERAEDLIAELYWRAEGTTKYSLTAGGWQRFSDWIQNRRFWSPYYRDRKFLFADSLRAVGEELPSEILNSFNAACAKVTEPGFLRGLRAVSGDLRGKIREQASFKFKDLKSEISPYLAEKQTLLQRLGGSTFSDADHRIRPRVELLEGILNKEVFGFISSLDYVPVKTSALEATLDRHLEKSLQKFPKIKEVVRGLVINFHFENSPSSYQEFHDWMEVRFEKVIALEREALLKEWRRRPIARKVTDEIAVSPPVEVSPSQAETVGAEEISESSEQNMSGADELEIVSLELFADTSPTSVPATCATPTETRAQRPWRFRRSAQKQVAAAEDETGVAFLVVLTPEARQDMIELSRSPKLAGQIRKALSLLAQNPQYGSLRTHENIAASQRRGDGKKVYRSAIHTGSSGHRIHWIYSGKDGRTIEVLEMVHHDEL